MSGTGTAGENSTVNGYVMSQSGSPPQAPAMGGSARSLNGSTQFFKLTADNNISGIGTPFSKAVSWVPGSTSTTQFVYGCLNAGFATLWRFQQNSGDVRVLIGDGSGSFDNYLLATGISLGTPIMASFSFDPVTKNFDGYINGSLVLSAVGTFAPTAPAGFCWIGHNDLGQETTGTIVAPTGWTRLLSGAEHALMWNGGIPQRL